MYYISLNEFAFDTLGGRSGCKYLELSYNGGTIVSSSCVLVANNSGFGNHNIIGIIDKDPSLYKVCLDTYSNSAASNIQRTLFPSWVKICDI